MGTHNSKEHKKKQNENRRNESQSKNGVVQQRDAEGSNAIENGDPTESTVQFNPVTQTNPMAVPISNYGVQAGTINIDGSMITNINIQQQIEKPENIEEFEHSFAQLQKKLKSRYKALTTKGLPWMGNVILTLERYYVALKMTKSGNSGQNLAPQVMAIEEIFVPLDGCTESFRILMEGAAGFGKTTLAAKLAYDWAKDEKHVHNFDLVLLIKLRHFAENWKETLIKEAGLSDAKDCEMLFKALDHNRKKFLIIFDGYDELPENHLTEVNSIIQKEVLTDVTVFITSRPGRFTSSTQLGETGLDISTFIDKRIQIVGLDPSMQLGFIKTYTANFKPNVQRIVLENIQELQVNEVLTVSFLQCPLFLLMIILLLTENRYYILQTIRTRTDLYKRLFNFVVRRCFCKSADGESKTTTPEIDLFSGTRDRASAQVRIMVRFSHFALYAIQKNCLVFSQNEVFDNCGDTFLTEMPDLKQLSPINLGLLVESVVEEGFYRQTAYEPIHKSILEFAAAYCI